MRWEVGDVSSKGTCWHTCLLGDRKDGRVAQRIPHATRRTKRSGCHADSWSSSRARRGGGNGRGRASEMGQAERKHPCC